MSAYHVTHRNPDGTYAHFCTTCGQAFLKAPHLAHVGWFCKCSGKQVTVLPTVSPSFKPVKPVRRISFKLPKPKCRFLGGDAGELVKVSCSSQWKQPQECYCPQRAVRISRTGAVLEKLAAWGWWCRDYGPAPPNDFTPVVLKFCQTCPHYQPQQLLTISEPLTIQPGREG